MMNIETIYTEAYYQTHFHAIKLPLTNCITHIFNNNKLYS